MKIYIYGFTLIEILITIAIFLLLVGVTLSTTTTNMKQYSFRDERDTCISSLQKVRSDAINNMCYGTKCTTGLSHGIHIEKNVYVIFQGDIYDPNDETNEVIHLYPTISLTGFSDIVFQKISGNTYTTPTDVQDIEMRDNGNHSSTITVNPEGRISWTN